MTSPDIRLHPIDGLAAWRDGRCLACGGATYGAPSDRAPADCLMPLDPQRIDGTRLADHPYGGDDYYVWCSNTDCEYYHGECVGDMECPPDWATHVCITNTHFVSMVQQLYTIAMQLYGTPAISLDAPFDPNVLADMHPPQLRVALQDFLARLRIDMEAKNTP